MKVIDASLAIDAKVDDLLIRWHEWTSGYNAAPRSHSGSMFRQAQSGRLWDRENGVDDASEKSTMVQMARAVDRVPNGPSPWQTMLHLHARNLATGREVWFSRPGCRPTARSARLCFWRPARC